MKTKFKVLAVALIYTLLFIPLSGSISRSEQVKTIAILPFETNTPKDISYITNGITSMMESRLAWKNNTDVIKRHNIQQALPEQQTGEGLDITKIGKKLHADYIIAGTITEFSGAFSIDTKVYDLNSGTYLTFFDQSETVDDIISKVDIVAAKINKKIFERSTVSYENFKKEKIITEEQLRRMNPERMMPSTRPVREEDKPWWKIW